LRRACSCWQERNKESATIAEGFEEIIEKMIGISVFLKIADHLFTF